MNGHTAEYSRLPPTRMKIHHTPSTKKISQWMLAFFWLALLLLLALIFNHTEHQRDNPNQQPTTTTDASGTRTIILQRNHTGYYQVSGHINHRPVIFLLDTGASHVAIPLALAKSLGLQRGAEFSSATANGSTQVYHTWIQTLQIGSIQLNQLEGTLLPNMKGEQILLGMSALQQLNFAQEGDRFILQQPK